MGPRLRTVLLALLLSAIATGIVATYLFSLSRKAEDGSTPMKVLVATGTIKAGTMARDLVSSSLVSARMIPKRYTVEGAMSDLSQVSGKVLAQDVIAGEQLATARFVASREAELDVRISAGRLAMAVPVDQDTGVSGKLRAGDRVAVFAAPGRGRGDGDGKLIVKGVEVLEVSAGQTSGGSKGSPNGRGTIVLAVSEVEAVKLVPAMRDGVIWVALMPKSAELAAAAEAR